MAKATTSLFLFILFGSLVLLVLLTLLILLVFLVPLLVLLILSFNCTNSKSNIRRVASIG